MVHLFYCCPTGPSRYRDLRSHDRTRGPATNSGIILVTRCLVPSISSCRARAWLLSLPQDLKPKDIVTRASFENAIVTVMALGGSTNAVLHLIAMARAFDIELDIDDFQTVSAV